MMSSRDTETCQREAIEWMLRLKPGTATIDDISAFKAWCRENPAHGEAFVHVRGLWQALGPAGEAAFDPGEQDRLVGARRRRQFGRRAFIAGAAAASVAACAAVRPPLHLWPSLSEWRADFRTATGEQRKVALGSDTTIQMNTQTSIGLRPAAGGMQRVELLAGEGMVTTGTQPLEIAAGSGRAIGANAQFNIRRDGDVVGVTCIAGEVRVACQGAVAVLAEQQRVTFSEGGLGFVSRTDAAVVTSWREGYLVFQDTPLADVVSEINRYRRGRIVVIGDALGRRPVNGRFYLARLDEVVGKLENAFVAHATSLPGGVVVLS